MIGGGNCAPAGPSEEHGRKKVVPSRAEMSSQSPSDRFKAEMPQIPGVERASAGRRFGPFANVKPAAALGAGVAVLAVLVFFVGRSAFRKKPAEPAPADPAPQIVIPTPESETRAGPPVATETNPEIATISELAAPWSSKEFFFRSPATGANVPALVVRLPGGSPAQGNSYWAFSLQAPYGNCKLEYITDPQKLLDDYGFRAKHPMVGNPCSRTVFDPLRLKDLPGNIWVRGAIAQGADLRPPIGIEIRVAGRDVQALRME